MHYSPQAASAGVPDGNSALYSVLGRNRGVTMDPAYDIFKQSSGKKLVFVERFRSLTQAEQHVVSLGAASAAEKYFIYDVRQGSFLRSRAD